MTGFFDGTYGALLKSSWRSRKLGRFTDPVFDFMINRSAARRKVDAAVADSPRQRVLIVGVVVPGREDDMRRVSDALGSTRHECHHSFVPMQDKGKFDNVNDAIERAEHPLDYFDWLVITDDDIAVGAGFLDELLGLLHANDIDLGQPAHRFRSYTSWRVTKRAWGSLVRETRYVEIGPLTVLNRRTFDALVPFPSMRWCWGLDVYWSDRAAKAGSRLGVVDATSVEHLRPVAGSYDDNAAKAEAHDFLDAQDAKPPRTSVMAPGTILDSWW